MSPNWVPISAFVLKQRSASRLWKRDSDFLAHLNQTGDFCICDSRAPLAGR